MTVRKILVVEDDAKIGALMCDYLKVEGYEARWLRDGASLLQQVEELRPSAVVLDVMLPGADGFALCERLRRASDVPLLFVTARVEEGDRLKGLAVGADDYLCKPFSMQEMLARIGAMIRRAEGRMVADPLRLHYGLDEESGRVAWAGQWLPLSPMEYRLLAALIRAPGRIFSRAELLDRAAPDFRDVSDRAIDSHMKNIRRKIEMAEHGAQPIATVYGIGYRFDPPAPGARG